MPVSSGGLVNVRVRGKIDSNYADVPSLWFKNASAGNKNLVDLAQSMLFFVRDRMLHRMASAYKLVQIELYALSGVVAILKTAGGVTTYKSSRAVWGDRYIQPGMGLVGGITTRPMPSFVAYGLTASIGNPRVIEYTTGAVGSNVPDIFPRGGGFRWPGVPEAATVDDDTAPNDLTDFYWSNVQTNMSLLVDIGNAFSADLGVSGDWKLMSISKNSLGGKRLIKGDPALPATWNPAWVASEVRSLTLSPQVTSQVSRKAKKGRLL